MCSVCMKNPCDSRCPNAPDPIPTEICSECGEGIFVGEKYFDGSDGAICLECMKNKSIEEILDLFGETLTTAEVE